MRNYQKELEKIIEENQQNHIVPSLLLHSCCAPCSSYCLEYLSQYFRITVFYYNPNIYPESEYIHRVQEQERLIRQMPANNQIKLIELGFHAQKFYSAVKGYEKEKEGGRRCFKCYRLRLEKTAEIAKEKEFDFFTTTLSISPLKNADKINEIGQDIAEKNGLRYLPSDFKKKNGYKRSIELSKEYCLYRQNYCGCIYSFPDLKQQ